jgi:hypothetical protein
MKRGGISRPRLSSSENIFQQRGGLGRWVGANSDLFLPDFVEEAIESFADDVLVEVEFVGDGVSAGSTLDDAVIPLEDADALQGTVDDGSERGRQIGGAGFLEVFGGSGIAAAEDVAGIAKCHFLERFEKYLFGLRRRAFGGAVHADFEFVHRVALPDQAHSLADRLEFRGQQDANGFVIQEPVRLASDGDGLAGGEFQSLLQSGNDVVVGGDGGVAVVRRSTGRRVIFGDLGCTAGAQTERQRDRKQRGMLKIFHGRLKG